jgi:hypothetical protein
MDKQLTGKPVALKLKNFVKSTIEKESLKPTMALIQLGNDPPPNSMWKTSSKTEQNWAVR